MAMIPQLQRLHSVNAELEDGTKNVSDVLPIREGTREGQDHHELELWYKEYEKRTKRTPLQRNNSKHMMRVYHGRTDTPRSDASGPTVVGDTGSGSGSTRGGALLTPRAMNVALMAEMDETSEIFLQWREAHGHLHKYMSVLEQILSNYADERDMLDDFVAMNLLQASVTLREALNRTESMMDINSRRSDSERELLFNIKTLISIDPEKHDFEQRLQEFQEHQARILQQRRRAERDAARIAAGENPNGSRKIMTLVREDVVVDAVEATTQTIIDGSFLLQQQGEHRDTKLRNEQLSMACEDLMVRMRQREQRDIDHRDRINELEDTVESLERDLDNLRLMYRQAVASTYAYSTDTNAGASDSSTSGSSLEIRFSDDSDNLAPGPTPSSLDPVSEALTQALSGKSDTSEEAEDGIISSFEKLETESYGGKERTEGDKSNSESQEERFTKIFLRELAKLNDDSQIPSSMLEKLQRLMGLALVEKKLAMEDEQIAQQEHQQEELQNLEGHERPFRVSNGEHRDHSGVPGKQIPNSARKSRREGASVHCYPSNESNDNPVHLDRSAGRSPEPASKANRATATAINTVNGASASATATATATSSTKVATSGRQNHVVGGGPSQGSRHKQRTAMRPHPPSGRPSQARTVVKSFSISKPPEKWKIRRQQILRERYENMRQILSCYCKIAHEGTMYGYFFSLWDESRGRPALADIDIDGVERHFWVNFPHGDDLWYDVGQQSSSGGGGRGEVSNGSGQLLYGHPDGADDVYRYGTSHHLRLDWSEAARHGGISALWDDELFDFDVPPMHPYPDTPRDRSNVQHAGRVLPKEDKNVGSPMAENTIRPATTGHSRARMAGKSKPMLPPLSIQHNRLHRVRLSSSRTPRTATPLSSRSSRGHSFR